MTIKPNSDYVLLEMEEPQLAGGLVVAGQNTKLANPYQRFIVREIGPGRMTAAGEMIPIMFVKGDYVLVPPPIQLSASQPPRMPCDFIRIGEPEAGGKVLFLIHADNILCKVKGEYIPFPEIIEPAPGDITKVKNNRRVDVQ